MSHNLLLIISENGLCPVCGCNSVINAKSVRYTNVPYANPVTYEETLESCTHCLAHGTLYEKYLNVFNAAVCLAEKESVGIILDDLDRMDIKTPYIERALGLPFGSVASWKNSEIPPPALALLRIIRTYPWILDVADNHYNETVAKNHLITEALTTKTQVLDN